jgi:hypothetical protein
MVFAADLAVFEEDVKMAHLLAIGKTEPHSRRTFLAQDGRCGLGKNMVRWA